MTAENITRVSRLGAEKQTPAAEIKIQTMEVDFLSTLDRDPSQPLCSLA